ncbi:MAG TPA: hypothetical protein VHL11_20715, partial [Phototrophicaceae bacterium]|nr:hypothetical protein [Phototrophicaceae bacterium]
TPAGKECRYYYEDFHRGRNHQECRLVRDNPDSLRWRPSDCLKCPIPDILNANSSKDMELSLTIKARFLGYLRYHEVTAFCLKHRIPIEDAYVGCPKCNAERPGLDVFRRALGQPEDD